MSSCPEKEVHPKVICDNTASNNISSAFESIEGIIRNDVGGRGAARLADPGGLRIAGENIVQSIQRRLSSGHDACVFILTGFLVRKASSLHKESGEIESGPETDGPIGCSMIARSLQCVFKHQVLRGRLKIVIITMSGAEAVVREAVRALCCDTEPSSSTSTEVIAIDGHVVESLVQNYCPQAVISIEVAGASWQNPCAGYTMRGKELGPKSCVSLFSKLFQISYDNPSVFTVAIADGGNELGCGSVLEILLQSDKIPFVQTIACGIKSDLLITCGVSNWGGFALGAAILMASSMERGNFDLNLQQCLDSWKVDWFRHAQAIRATLLAGAVDGMSGSPVELQVDGLSFDVHHGVLVSIVQVLNGLLCRRTDVI